MIAITDSRTIASGGGTGRSIIRITCRGRVQVTFNGGYQVSVLAFLEPRHVTGESVAVLPRLGRSHELCRVQPSNSATTTSSADLESGSHPTQGLAGTFRQMSFSAQLLILSNSPHTPLRSSSYTSFAKPPSRYTSFAGSMSYAKKRWAQSPPAGLLAV